MYIIFLTFYYKVFLCYFLKLFLCLPNVPSKGCIIIYLIFLNCYICFSNFFFYYLKKVLKEILFFHLAFSIFWIIFLEQISSNGTICIKSFTNFCSSKNVANLISKYVVPVYYAPTLVLSILNIMFCV